MDRGSISLQWRSCTLEDMLARSMLRHRILEHGSTPDKNGLLPRSAKRKIGKKGEERRRPAVYERERERGRDRAVSRARADKLGNQTGKSCAEPEHLKLSANLGPAFKAGYRACLSNDHSYDAASVACMAE